jgi:hypothetical protein
MMATHPEYITAQHHHSNVQEGSCVQSYTMEEVWVACRTLGVHPAPDGNYHKEAAFLLNKGNHYAAHLSGSNLSEIDTFTFHQSTYVPSMMYSMPITTLEVPVLNKI